MDIGRLTEINNSTMSLYTQTVNSLNAMKSDLTGKSNATEVLSKEIDNINQVLGIVTGYTQGLDFEFNFVEGNFLRLREMGQNSLMVKIAMRWRFKAFVDKDEFKAYCTHMAETLGMNYDNYVEGVSLSNPDDCDRMDHTDAIIDKLEANVTVAFITAMYLCWA